MKKLVLGISMIILFFATFSCEKEEEKEIEPCGCDSCLVSTCKHHPEAEWRWEHCYDYSLKSTDLFGPIKYYYRETYEKMCRSEDVYKLIYGNFRKNITHEYDIWNRKK